MASTYRGVASVGATPTSNIAETTPFRQFEVGEMITIRARCLEESDEQSAPEVTCTVQVAKTTLFDGPISQNITSSSTVSPQWNALGLRPEDLLYSGGVPVRGTLSVVFKGADAGPNDVLWEMSG